MRIKVGDKWFGCEPDQPIMIVLTPQDKENIAALSEQGSMYAIFHNDDKLSTEEKLDWMRAGE